MLLLQSLKNCISSTVDVFEVIAVLTEHITIFICQRGIRSITDIYGYIGHILSGFSFLFPILTHWIFPLLKVEISDFPTSVKSKLILQYNAFVL